MRNCGNGYGVWMVKEPGSVGWESVSCRVVVENRKNFVYNERQERQVEMHVYYWIL